VFYILYGLAPIHVYDNLMLLIDFRSRRKFESMIAHNGGIMVDIIRETDQQEVGCTS